MPEILPRQLEILQHALGLDQYGRVPRGHAGYTRNYFAAGTDDEPDCRELVAMGLMKEHRTTEVFPDYNCSVTDAGKQAVREQSPKPPKLTRSQQRYRDFLAADTGFSFREYLKTLTAVAKYRRECPWDYELRDF